MVVYDSFLHNNSQTIDPTSKYLIREKLARMLVPKNINRYDAKYLPELNAATLKLTELYTALLDRKYKEVAD